MKNINLIKRKKGFTLVELMVVLAIIATMTFIAVPNFTSIKTSVNEKVDKQSCEAIKRIITTFVIDETIDASKQTVNLTYNATGENKGINGIDKNSDKIKTLNSALNDVKPPRSNNDELYKISVNKGGSNIVVSVGNICTD
ncbi:prepilin-type N-terminal cleavage/methylation domain-containing protein [Sarcina sp. JB2]|uniref:Prepilin-type N-terminal cleavage/methylation domain-containing protein n=1 Tax=Candidatus Sarcina troglodytae TaxID=2726954 RepID=A0ACD1BF76_9CLOT|nr:type II secretion system protein [Sarcina sp. JB2]QPJ86077.1 prepilin-type N-terminal cleavage/methylation domain-containing protein [Sarcina sp. JB2]